MTTTVPIGHLILVSYERYQIAWLPSIFTTDFPFIYHHCSNAFFNLSRRTYFVYRETTHKKSRHYNFVEVSFEIVLTTCKSQQFFKNVFEFCMGDGVAIGNMTASNGILGFVGYFQPIRGIHPLRLRCQPQKTFRNCILCVIHCGFLYYMSESCKLNYATHFLLLVVRVCGLFVALAQKFPVRFI